MATSQLEAYALQLLQERGVTVEQIGELVLFLQEKYIPDLDLEVCLKHVKHVLTKRDVQNAIITGITLDKLAENKQLEDPLQSIIEQDEGLYGIDEVIALSIVNIYGSIGFTNFGYIDKVKPGLLARLNDKTNGCHTFLDDIVGAIAAAASSRLAHTVSRLGEG
ncbi:phosphatidylglycerophosphatase A [Caldalkalibacillus thermarum]|uniref:phosphatidylglycerophosphatase A family protein n=1 Tax=Caldalkalibacillus thermarum TaxID=296745 RepID=UPI0016634430|nr:phosphatidylglycerophosphatase A [Caldalkalibacillus thermarum]GGK21863.1 phosphatidylglycerophosphatase A [Caldalkalibacillus thermarum]